MYIILLYLGILYFTICVYIIYMSVERYYILYIGSIIGTRIILTCCIHLHIYIYVCVCISINIYIISVYSRARQEETVFFSLFSSGCCVYGVLTYTISTKEYYRLTFIIIFFLRRCRERSTYANCFQRVGV